MTTVQVQMHVHVTAVAVVAVEAAVLVVAREREGRKQRHRRMNRIEEEDVVTGDEFRCWCTCSAASLVRYSLVRDGATTRRHPKDNYFCVLILTFSGMLMPNPAATLREKVGKAMIAAGKKGIFTTENKS